MKGLELAKAYYQAYGKEVLESQFSHVLPFLAIGLAGSGSECCGYDDEISQDHDFEPGFCIFLPGEDVVDRRTAFQLERAYAKLPNEFMGIKRNPLSPVGGNRHGVIRINDFFSEKVGNCNGSLSLEEWFSVPEYGLLEATNGEIFEDPYGAFSAVRQALRYYPEDVRRKKLAGHLLLMGQAGQYNYTRCIKRGETGAAQLAAFEFVKSTLHCIYLLNRAYMPYYKWCFKGLESLPRLRGLSKDLEYLISSGNSSEEAVKKAELIEAICFSVAEEARNQKLTRLKHAEMEPLAYSVNDTVADHSIRNLHILYGV